MDRAVSVTAARILEHGDAVAPAYRVDGRALAKETRLPLLGYPGGAVVVGNWVNQQFQLDAIGEILTLLATAAAHDRLDDDGRQALELSVRIVEKRWKQPDAGIWELTDRWWTQSRLSVVAGLRAAARHVASPLNARASALADAILAETDRRCLRPDGVWRRAPDLDGTDASLVLPPVRGALPADDPRTVATLAAVMEELAQDGFAYRFRTGERPLGDDEGAFLLCGFTVALAHWHQGRPVEALRWFERTSSAGGSPGILSEEYDVVQRQLRGNLPQSFVHAMLLETAQTLYEPPPDPT
jgi:GH15 family glucan-1,4-alpha-glucosidase